MTETTARPYSQRCATCRHDHWQNDLVGDCQALRKDVYHHSTEACSEYEGMPPKGERSTNRTRSNHGIPEGYADHDY